MESHLKGQLTQKFKFCHYTVYSPNLFDFILKKVKINKNKIYIDIFFHSYM